MQGIILLNKPTGITSFGAVSAVRRLTHQKRIGHTGTLDPDATGVLPILLGRATALSSLLIDADKRYKAVIKLGVTTDTEDIGGNILTENEVNITSEQLENALKKFTGDIKQKPPMYSALKQDGVRLYKLAREGKTANIPEREVTVHTIKLLSSIDENNCFLIETLVSKGTYIRSLARDIGEYLGCGGCIYSLCRTFTGGFSIDETVPLENLSEDNINNYILSEEKAVEYLRKINVTQKQAVRFCNGGQLFLDRLKIENLKDGELLRVGFEDLFLGVGEVNITTGLLNIKCVINYIKAVNE